MMSRILSDKLIKQTSHSAYSKGSILSAVRVTAVNYVSNGALFLILGHSNWDVMLSSPT